MDRNKETLKISLTTLEVPVLLEFVTYEYDMIIVTEWIPANTTRIFCVCWPGFYSVVQGVPVPANIKMRIRGFVRNLTLAHDPRHKTYQWIVIPTYPVVRTVPGTYLMSIKNEGTAPTLRTLATAAVRAFALQRTLQPGDIPATLHAELMGVEETHYPVPVPGRVWEWTTCPFSEPTTSL